MQTHSLPRPWRYLAAKLMRQAMKYASAYSTYTPPVEETPIVSRQRRMAHHFKTGELAEADVIQGTRFTLTCFIGSHGHLMQIDSLRDMLQTNMINLYTKVQDGLMPLALKPGNETPVDEIIAEIEQATEAFLIDMTALLHARGVVKATTPFYYVPKNKAS